MPLAIIRIPLQWDLVVTLQMAKPPVGPGPMRPEPDHIPGGIWPEPSFPAFPCYVVVLTFFFA